MYGSDSVLAPVGRDQNDRTDNDRRRKYRLQCQRLARDGPTQQHRHHRINVTVSGRALGTNVLQ